MPSTTWSGCGGRRGCSATRALSQEMVLNYIAAQALKLRAPTEPFAASCGHMTKGVEIRTSAFHTVRR